MSKSLFDSFSEVSSKQWVQKVQYELDGLDFNKTLLGLSPDKIHIKPYYTAEDLAGTSPVSPTRPVWGITEYVDAEDTERLSIRITEAIEGGSEVLFLENASVNTLEHLPSNLPEKCCHLFLSPSKSTHEERNALLNQVNTSLLTLLIWAEDPLSELITSGNPIHTPEADLEAHRLRLKDLFRRTGKPPYLVIRSRYLEQGGAQPAQELAAALSQASEYYHYWRSEGDRELIENVIPLFELGIGRHFFTEVAKQKALPSIWAGIAREFKAQESCRVIAVPGIRNKTITDFNNNLLRTTTELMSAVAGGAHWLGNLPYDVLYKYPNTFSSRIARNQMLIMKYEGHLDKVLNVADGAYFPERFTKDFTEKTLQHFHQLEEEGGFLSSVTRGHLQERIAAQAMESQKAYDDGSLKLVGSNCYEPAEGEGIPQIEKDPFPRHEDGKTLLRRIPVRRLASRRELHLLKKVRS